jgi:hypothetical protein
MDRLLDHRGRFPHALKTRGPRYGRRANNGEGEDVAAVASGHRHGSRVRTLTGTFGKTEIAYRAPG